MQPDENEIKTLLMTKSKVEEILPSGLSIISLLDRGGQGVVYRGVVNGRSAAIKIYFPGQVRQRIEREVSALASIDCENIVKLLLFDDVTIGGRRLPLVATELVDGHSLNQIIRQRKLNTGELNIISYDVTRAIEALWSNRIVHRDLKPSNIMVKASGRACVIDLGIARHLDQSSLTAYGLIWGTYGYLSPEQAQGIRQLTCKSDIYSLGIVLIESALGHHPTLGDQQRLFTMGFHARLPDLFPEWEHSSLLRTMLHPRATGRPMPAKILAQIANI